MKKIPIIGIGASAGGLKEFEHFFKNTPSSKSVAFVIIQHLSPDHKSILADIVNRYTKMDVCQAEDKMPVKAGNVYIIPPNKLLTLDNGKLCLSTMKKDQGIHLPIDVFFRSLKNNLNEQAIAVILSGTGSDGTLGIKEVKEAGGLTIVQQPDTAEYSDMPQNAIKTGLIDYVIPVPEMPGVIHSYIENEFQEHKIIGSGNGEIDPFIDEIFDIVKAQTANDFTLYKRSTVYRRIERRLTVNKINSLKEYLKLLKKSSGEVFTLNKEFLISVTSFFRDIETFRYFEKKIIPEIVSHAENVVRIWVPACATGEEAYTWAMLFKKHIDDNKLNLDLQVFASDIDVDAIAKGREAFYTNNIAADVPKDLLERYFIKEKAGFRVKKTIRETVIFAEQNLVQDPPYSRLDMVSCRNLLIYLDNELQQKAISIAHYALNQNGILMLGNSESLGNAAQYFSIIDRKHKVFHKINNLEVSTRVWKLSHGKRQNSLPLKKTDKEPISEIAKEFILERHTPPSIVINADGEMIYAQGRTGKFLEIATGEISTNIIKTAREGLKMPLSNTLRKAKVTNKEITLHNIRVKTNGDYEYIDLLVAPLKHHENDTKLFIVLFEPVKHITSPISEEEEQSSEQVTIYELEKELAEKEQYLQNTIEELETTNEELKSSNEEAQSTNEELQSTNEELETSKEELQSVNEELTTTNNELNHKIEELHNVNSNLKNLLAATDIATIFLDKELRIFNFTPSVAAIIDLLHSDIGRSIKQFTNNLKYDKLLSDAKEVLNNLAPKEVEVQTTDDRYFWMRTIPYRTIDDLVEGVVITFTDITEKKKQEEELDKHRNHLEELVEEKTAELKKSEALLKRTESITHIGSWEWDVKTDTVTWSDELFKIFNLDKEKGVPGYYKGHNNLYTEESQKLLDECVKKAIDQGEPYEVELDFFKNKKDTGILKSYGFPQKNAKGKVEKLFGSVQDITERKKAEKKIREKDAQFRKLSANVPDLIFQFTKKTDGSYCVPVASEGINNIFGCTPEDVKDNFDAIAKVLHPDDAERVMKDIEYSAEHLTFFTCEFRVIIPGKPVQWIFSRSSPEKLPDGSTTWFGFNANITERKIAEQELIKKNAFIQRILDDFPIGIATNEIDSQKVNFMNAKFAEIYGWPPEDFPTTLDFFNKVFPDKAYREELQKKIMADIESGDPKRMHWENLHITTKKGEKRFVNAFNIPIADQNIMLSTAMDVTERKMAENALQESEGQLRAIVGSSLNAIIVADDLGNYTSVNKATCEMFGYTEKELLNMNVEKIRTKTPKTADKLYKEYLKKGKAIGEFEFINGKGKQRIALYHAVRIGKNFNLSILSDITERKKAEGKLKQNQQFLKKSQQIGKIGTWHMDIEKDTLTWTEENYKIFGVPSGTRMNYQQFIKCIHPDDREYLNIEWMACLNGKPYDIEHRIIVGKEIKWVREKAELVTNEKKEPIAAFGVTQDITYKKHIENEMNNKANELYKLNRDKDRFISVLAHDLKSPFNSLVGFSNLLVQNIHTYEIGKIEKQAKLVNDTAKRIFKMLEEILDWSRAKEGRIEFRPENQNLYKICNATLELISDQAHTKGISIICKVPEEFLVNTDINLISTVLRNLLSNAIKFTRPGGDISIYGKKNNDEIIVSVQDSGIGMEEEFLNHLFNISETASTPGTCDEKGTGLGLHIAKEFIEIQGGRIWAESEIEKGSTFYITIPVAKHTVQSNESDVKNNEAKKATILITEDEHVNFELLNELILSYLKNNVEILHAVNGIEAIEMCKTHAIDLVLMDIKMPKLDGLSACVAIKKFKPDLPIIIQSANADRKNKNKAAAIGCCDFIEKPINIEKLHSVLTKYL